MRHAPTDRHVLPCLLLALVVALAACGGTSDLTAGGGPGEPDQPAVAAERLAEEQLEDHGCAYAFTAGTPDQTIRLSLWSSGGPGSPPHAGTHELGEDWTGELVVGRDLFAQWCDDVIGPDEPEVVEEASWQVAGTLTWELAEGEGQCPSVATATLTDASLDTGGGTVRLPDLELRNEFFGCFAG